MNASAVHRLWRWLRVPLILYAALVLFACSMADRLIFLPPNPSYSADAKALIRIETEAGEVVTALHRPATPGRPTLLYSHGNAEDIGHSLPLHQRLSEAGFGVFAYDYPGYGQASGHPTEASCERAIQCAWNHLTQDLGVAPAEVVIVGRSIGSGPSVWLDSRVKARALVLISPFTSVFAVRPPAHRLIPGDRFPNEQRIRRSDTPLLVIHGEADRVIPIRHGRAIVEASAAKRKRLVTLPNTGHNDLFLNSMPQIVAELEAFTE
jgi:alpha-beta hydrolase superfamily lysophospholipase